MIKRNIMLLVFSFLLPGFVFGQLYPRRDDLTGYASYGNGGSRWETRAQKEERLKAQRAIKLQMERDKDAQAIVNKVFSKFDRTEKRDKFNKEHGPKYVSTRSPKTKKYYTDRKPRKSK